MKQYGLGRRIDAWMIAEEKKNVKRERKTEERKRN